MHEVAVQGVEGDGRTPPVACKSILVVEDDEDIRESLAAVLEAEGYTVFVAANGKEALERLAVVAQPCLILLDLMMPIMGGIEFLSLLRKEDVLAAIPVVILSAWSKEAEKASNTQGFVRKPVDLEALLRLVQQYC